MTDQIGEPVKKTDTSLMKLMVHMKGTATKADVCPLCGFTVEEYRRTELLGCGLCYSALGIDIPVSQEDK